MSFIISMLAGAGLPQRLATKLAPWAAGIAAMALLAALWAIFDHFNDRAAIERDRMQGNIEQLEDQAQADADAADRRLADQKRQQEEQEAYDEAIHRPQPGDSTDARVRLACERLRRDGQDTTGLAACGGR